MDISSSLPNSRKWDIATRRYSSRCRCSGTSLIVPQIAHVGTQETDEQFLAHAPAECKLQRLLIERVHFDLIFGARDADQLLQLLLHTIAIQFRIGIEMRLPRGRPNFLSSSGYSM